MSRAYVTSSSSSSSSSNEDHHHRRLRTRSKEEIIGKRREAWLIQQERERKHEIRKQKMILEYELKRAAMLSSNRDELGSKELSRRASHRSRRESRSISSQHGSRDRKRHSPSYKPSAMSQKLESSSGISPLFEGPEGRTFSLMELCRIKVDIHRNIPGSTATYSELQRDITNFEEITLKRREDEGVKPIFEREELKLPESTVNEEVQEHRTVKSIDYERLENTSHSLGRRSTSLSLSTRYYQNVSEISSPHRTSYSALAASLKEETYIGLDPILYSHTQSLFLTAVLSLKLL